MLDMTHPCLLTSTSQPPRCQLTASSEVFSNLAKGYIYLVKLFSSIKSTNWPVGAMVARSPPKAEAVGSSPTSVAFNDLVLRIILFAALLSLQHSKESPDGVDINFCMVWRGGDGPSFQNNPTPGLIIIRDQLHMLLQRVDLQSTFTLMAASHMTAQ
jgi:hypothetical protein